MINIRKVRHVAGYEVKLLFRNRVFLLLAFLVGLGTPVCLYFIQAKFFFWNSVALPCILPVSNALLFGCFQPLLVIFTVCEWRTRERLSDTLPALSVRPYGNADYLTGKAVGIVGVMTLVGMLAFLPLMVYHAFDEELVFNGWYYLFYWATLTLPALIFITGFSFWICTWIRSPFLSLIILVSFYLTDLFVFQEWEHGVLDFMAVAVPNTFSQAVGHVGLESYLWHRLWIALAGISLLAFAVVTFLRKDDTPRTTVGWKIMGGALMLLALGAGALYYGPSVCEKQLREDYRRQCISYQERPRVEISDHAIVWRQEKGRMEVTDTLTVVNPSEQDFSEILFYLNPGLGVERIEHEGESLPFRQTGVVTEVKASLAAGGRKRLVVKYGGHIDERICYLHVSDSLYEATAWSNGMHRYGKRMACVSDRYTFLIPECLWYPQPQVPYHSGGPLVLERVFSHFRLDVRHPENRMAVSQGSATVRKNGTVFTNAYPLVGMSLVVGAYEKKCYRVDSLCSEVYFFDPEGDFISTLDGSEKGVVEGMREVMEKWKNRYGRAYPFSKIALIETPVSLCSYLTVGGEGSGFVQPELLFVPENWCLNSENISLKARVRFDKKSDPLNIDTETEAACVRRIYLGDFKDFRDEFPPMSFIDHLTGRRWFFRKVKNPWSVTPMFTDYCGVLRSDEFPGIDRVIDRTPPDELENIFGKQGRIGTPAEYRALQYLSRYSLQEALADPEAKDLLTDIFQQKESHFRRYMNALVGQKKFRAFLNDWKGRHMFTATDFRVWAGEIRDRFGIDAERVVRQLYEQKGLPTLLVRDLRQEAVGDSVFFVFDAWNPSEVDGLLTCYIRENDLTSDMVEDTSLLVRAGECVHLALPLESPCTKVIVHTNLSANLPREYSRYFSEKTEPGRQMPPARQAFDPAGFDQQPDELIVDNEDPGFRLVESKVRKILSKGKLVDGYASSVDFLTGNFRGWVPSIHENAWGRRLRSFYAKSVGNGDSKAEWTADLPEDGEYEVFVHYIGVRNRVELRDSVRYCYELDQGKLKAGIEMLMGKNIREFGIKIEANDGYEDEFYYRLRDKDADWIPVGRYNLEAGKVRLTLYDRGIDGRLIFADAVKWVKRKGKFPAS